MRLFFAKLLFFCPNFGIFTRFSGFLPEYIRAYRRIGTEIMILSGMKVEN